MKRVIRVGAINIVTHPHSVEGYKNLIQKVERRKQAARIRGDRFGMISVPDYPAIAKRDSVLHGFIGTFTKIDADSDWISTRTGRRAQEEERQVLQNLPKDGLHNHR